VIPNTTDGSDVGAWVNDTAGTTTLLSRKNRPFARSPGDTRTINVTGYRILVASQPPWRTWLNNRGELAYLFALTDTTSALVVATIDPPITCRADFNNTGGVTLQDLFDYLGVWFAGC
jgi:hypothetical protein